MLKGVYVIADNNGRYIREDPTTRKYVPIRSFKQAKCWDSREKAASVLKNSIGKNIRDKFRVKFIEIKSETTTPVNQISNEVEDIQSKNKKAVSYNRNPAPTESHKVVKQIKESAIEADQIDSWLKKLNEIMNVVSGLDNRKSYLLGKLSNVDKKIVDVEHYIEFYDFNAAQGWGCYKMLQTLLRQRRNYKDELRVITAIEQGNIQTDSLSQIMEKIAEVQSQEYTPRALPELFKNKKSNYKSRKQTAAMCEESGINAGEVIGNTNLQKVREVAR